MGKQSNRKLIAFLPHVFVATFLVAVAPVLVVLWLRTSGVMTSVWAGMVVGAVISFLAAYAGGALWKTRVHSRDLLFSELMLWGWVQRWRAERRLIAATDLLGLSTDQPKGVPTGGLTHEQKADLLTQLTAGLEARDPYTHGHSRRVARHAANIAKRMGLSPAEVAKVRAAGAMHDVGKLETPVTVLHKEGKLTDEEYAIVKRHPVDGAVMVAMIDDDELTAMVRHHHERLDGNGYPDGLAGEAIPVGARIIAVADTFDAITSTRSYRQAHAHKKALDILVAEAGTQLDPDAVRAFRKCYSGRRPLAYWTILANARPRFLSFLGSGLGTAHAGSLGNVMATAATTAAVGGIAVGGLVAAPDSSRALADGGPPRASSKAPSPQTSRRDELLAPKGGRDRPDRRIRRSSPARTVPVSSPGRRRKPPIRSRSGRLEADDIVLDAVPAPGNRPDVARPGNGGRADEDKAPKDKTPKDKTPKDKTPKDKAPTDKTPKVKEEPKGQAKDKEDGRPVKNLPVIGPPVPEKKNLPGGPPRTRDPGR